MLHECDVLHVNFVALDMIVKKTFYIDRSIHTPSSSPSPSVVQHLMFCINTHIVSYSHILFHIHTLILLSFTHLFCDSHADGGPNEHPVGNRQVIDGAGDSATGTVRGIATD